ncbi:MAG TPA: peptidase domain-containing ABC transporter [Stellaceae bacterium]|nr:peptidase domain-containing ABC transporter [Stellaceae bacterium]
MQASALQVGALERPTVPTALQCLVMAARHHGVHLSADQLIREHALGPEEPNSQQLAAAGGAHGLTLGEIRLRPRDFSKLARGVPAIIHLKNGNSVLLTAIAGKGQAATATVLDPAVGESTPLITELDRIATAAEGVLLIRRDGESRDAAAQPFGLGWLVGQVVTERRQFRDIAIAAAMMSVLALAPAIFWQLVVDRVLAHRSLATLNVLVGGMALIIMVDMLFGYARRSLILFATARIDARLSTYVFNKLLDLPIDFFERTPTGVLTRDVNEIWRIRTFLTGQLFGTVLDGMVLLVILPAMFWFSPVLACIVLALGALMVLIVAGFLPFIRKRTTRAFLAEGQQNAFLVETVQGVRTVKSLALEPRRRHGWDRHVASAVRLRRHAGALANLAQTMIAPLEKLMTSGVIALAAYGAITAGDPVYLGTLMAFGILAQRVAQPLVQLAHLIQQFDEANRAVRTVAAVVNQAPEDGRDVGGSSAPLKGAIEFEAVRFRYAGATTPALDRLSFNVPAGTIFGIMGRSGSGKTTITRLLQGLHRHYEGMIRVDGTDIRAIDLDHLRRSTGVVLQDSFLFSGTVRDNIAASCPTASFEQVAAAARMAGAEEFIERLPRGYDTVIEEGSANLSGGQRQRIAIARALLVDPKLLILDEATSALDPESEAIVNANLQRIAQGRTVVVISHRLASLIAADAILVLDQGSAVDVGRHTELLQRCKLYARLWNQQNRHTLHELDHDIMAAE